MDTRELFARLIQCEAGGEGTDGMMGVATVVMNRATINYGEFARINGGGRYPQCDRAAWSVYMYENQCWRRLQSTECL